jgi:MerR family transcriptional regulator, thiopeptide resistance regulator
MTESTTRQTLTVGQVAEQFDVTVRTLHHYDEIGLLRPSDRSASGYRLYTEADLTALQHIVVYRRLGFGLEEIALLLANPAGVEEHLLRQRAAVTGRLDELHQLVAAIDNALEKERTGMKVTKEDMRELFGDGFNEEYAVEAEQRWGDTDAWRQSQQRTKSYSKEDWAAIKAETDAINAALVAAKRSGVPATDPAAMDAAEAHRAQMNERFFDVSTAFHRNLGDMYICDPRFTKTYEDLEPGLAQFVRDAIHANADRQDAVG